MAERTLRDTRIIDPVLTELALGYKNLAFVGENLLPRTPVPKMGVKIPEFGKEHFVVEDDVRALFGPSNEITPVKITARTLDLIEHDLGHPIDYLENKETDFAYERYALRVVLEKMALNHEKRIAALVTNESVYGTNNKIVLSGTSKFSDKTSDLFGVFDDGLEKVANACGYGVNQMIIPADVWRSIKRHPEVTAILKERGVKLLTPKMFSDLLGDEFGSEINIRIGRARYKATLDAESMPLWTKDIVMAYVPPANDKGERDFYEPAFGYTPTRKDGVFVDTYDKEGGKVYVKRVTDIHKEYLLMPEAGFLIKDCV